MSRGDGRAAFYGSDKLTSVTYEPHVCHKFAVNINHLTVSDFKTEKLIEIDNHGVITIVDENKLAELPN